MKFPMPLGPLMIDIAGVELSQDDKEILKHPLIGGIILFSRNYETKEQVTQLCQQIHGLRDEALLISVDHEGGRVQRFREGFSAIPCMQALGEQYEKDNHKGLQGAEHVAWLMAAELREVGVDFSFAPVLDINHGCSEVIGDRSFSTDKKVLAKVAAAFQVGLKSAGMVSIGKHFPGHGAVAPDSHIEIPIDTRPYAEIMADDVFPFKELINAGMDGIMPAHVIYQKVDELPAGFSPFWLQKVLRGELAFKGTIFSDDLTMHGASVIGDFAQRARQALKAGCDMVLVCNDRKASEQVIDALSDEEVIAASTVARISAMRAKPFAELGEVFGSMKWQLAHKAIQLLA
ncbi:MAG: beta-N-acetylhexosaminidase [Piscirickettsiaceae bacterium]|nr:MAG: beta-N-acetylhexosaminidase [Piscirickettsiaceae bacterium]